MAKLWVFGDSFSDSCGLLGKHPYSIYLNNNLKLEFDDIPNLAWQVLLAKELNLELKNFSRSGGSNQDIINQITLNINNFSFDDFIIVGWTLPSRVSLPAPPTGYPYETISIANAWSAQNIDSNYGYKYYESFYLNVFFPNIDKHMDFWSEMGDALFKNLLKNYNVKSWYWPNLSQQVKLHRIIDHSNGLVIDDHPSINGHIQIKNILKDLNWGDHVILSDITDDLKKLINNPDGIFI